MSKHNILRKAGIAEIVLHLPKDMIDKIHEAMRNESLNINKLVTDRIKDLSCDWLGIAEIDEYSNIEYGEYSFPFKLSLPREYAFSLGLMALRTGIPQSLIVSWLLEDFCVGSWISLVSPNFYRTYLREYHK